MGRPRSAYPRNHLVGIRFSDTEWGALHQALEREFPVLDRRPKLVEVLRDLAVAYASDVLSVKITRAGTRHERGGVASFKQWKIAKAVKRAGKRRRKPTQPQKRPKK